MAASASRRLTVGSGARAASNPPLTAAPMSRASSTPLLFCFFQAEGGIRDTSVTGVQTCALPILIPVELLAADPLDVIPHTLARRLGRLPAESLELGYVRNAVARVTDAVFTADIWFDAHAQRFRHYAREFEDRVAVTATDVEHLVVRLVALQHQPVGAGDVTDIDVIAKLLAVFKH